MNEHKEIGERWTLSGGLITREIVMGDDSGPERIIPLPRCKCGKLHTINHTCDCEDTPEKAFDRANSII
jgi:hypothetical protein